MKTITLSSIALLFLSLSFFSCAKPEEELKLASSTPIEEEILPLAHLSAEPMLTQCPDCVTNFDANTSSASTNAVYNLSSSGILTAAGTTTTTVILSTVQTYTVGNVVVTVSHDADNIYFILQRSNATGGFGNFRFYSPAQIPVPSSGPGNVGVPAGTKKIQIIKSRTDIAACSEISFSFRVGGGGNPTIAGDAVTTEALHYTLHALCAPTCFIEVGDYRTQTRGYWRNNNGQAFLNAHTNLFPFNIGCDNNTMSFENPGVVKTYLESEAAKGTPAALPNAGTLGAQVLTLLINVTADKKISDFAASANELGNLKVDISNNDIVAHPEWSSLTGWNGKSVKEILSIAQEVAGGCSDDYTFSDVNAIVTAINENFDNGTVDNGLLTCGD